MAFTKPNVNTPWAETGEIISPSGSKVAQGWIEEIPDFEFENWIQNRSDQFNAHVNQYGITVWDAVTQYITDKSYVQASNGVVYRAATTNTNKNPLTNSSDWSRAFNDPATIYTKTESDTKYATRANNLSDLANAATARTNLSVYSKSETDTSYAKRSNNLSDLQSSSNARSNIDVYSTGESDGRYLNESSNLSDLSNNLTARSNLDVYSKADVYTKSQTDTKYAQRSNNLSDLQSSATARSNLDVYSTGESDGRYLNEASNLSDLSNAATARTNLSVYSKAEADAYVAHLKQRGIPEWDAEGDYLNGKSYVQGSNGVLYISTDDSIGEDPTTVDSNFWEPLSKSGYALTVAPGTVVSGGAYYLDGTFTTTLPDTTGLVNGDTVKFIKDILETPIIEVDGTNSENIITENGTDTSVFFDINSEIIFVFNGTNWEV